jgi:hypothetical protein
MLTSLGNPCLSPSLNPKTEVRDGGAGRFRGARVSGVRFSASRRKPRPANFFPPKIPERVGDKSSGARPNSHAGRVRSPFQFQNPGSKPQKSAGLMPGADESKLDKTF